MWDSFCVTDLLDCFFQSKIWLEYIQWRHKKHLAGSSTEVCIQDWLYKHSYWLIMLGSIIWQTEEPRWQLVSNDQVSVTSFLTVFVLAFCLHAVVQLDFSQANNQLPSFSNFTNSILFCLLVIILAGVGRQKVPSWETILSLLLLVQSLIINVPGEMHFFIPVHLLYVSYNFLRCQASRKRPRPFLAFYLAISRPAVPQIATL